MRWFHLLATCCLAVACLSSSAQDSAQAHGIRVTGFSELRLPPDMVDFVLTLKTRRPTLEDARTANESDMRVATKQLQEEGISTKDLQMDRMSLEPGYAKDRGQQSPDYYQVERHISVHLGNPDQLDKVLGRITHNGMVAVSGVTYGASKWRDHRDELRRQAIQAARQKAESIAKELGVRLGRVLSVHDFGLSITDDWRGNSGSNVYNEVTRASEGHDDSGPLGQVAMNETLEMTFAIE